MAVWVVAMVFNWLRARVSPEGGCGEPVSATDGGALQVRRGEVECGAVFNDATADDGIWTPDAFMARVQLVGGIVLGLTGPFPDTAAARMVAESVAGVLNSVLGCRPLDVRMVERAQDYGPALRQLAL